MDIKSGIYKHSKSGKKYKVIGSAKHSETLEEMVIYKPLYESEVDYWVRPANMWNEEVEINNVKTTRFVYEGE